MMTSDPNESQPSSSNLAAQPTTDAASNGVAQAQTTTANAPAAKAKSKTPSNATKKRFKKTIVTGDYDDDYYVEDPNFFDGMTNDDADAFMANLWPR